MKKFIYFVLVLSLAGYCFLAFNVDFSGPDEPIYYSYAQSIAEDGDLNAINQDLSKSHQLAVSKTYNLPDFHNHGGVIIWAPFYIYAKLFYPLAGRLGAGNASDYSFEDFTRCIMSFSTVIAGLLAMALTYFFAKSLFRKSNCFWPVIVLFLSTPFFYYMLLEPGNANILSAFFFVISALLCYQWANMKKYQFILYGMFVSVSLAVKTELWIQFVIIIPFFFILLFFKKTNRRSMVYFLSGFFFVFLLRGVNAYLKYGSLHLEELIYLKSALVYWPTYNFNGLFASFRGIFYSSPVLYICLAGFIFTAAALINNRKDLRSETNLRDIFILLLAAALIFKLLLVGRIFSPGGATLSVRVFLSEFFIFVILFCRALCGRRKYMLYLIVPLSLLFIFWNFLIISEYLCGLDWFYAGSKPDILNRMGSFAYARDYLFGIKSLRLKIAACAYLSLIAAGSLVILARRFRVKFPPSFLRENNNRPALNILFIFAFYCVFSYTAVTLANSLNNKENTERLKATGVFDDSVFLEAPPLKMSEFEQEQHLNMVFERIRYHLFRGEAGKLKKIIRQRKDIFGEKECRHVLFSRLKTPYRQLAVFYLNEGRTERALDCYQKAIKLSPGNIDLLLNMGNVYLNIGDYQKAISFFDKAYQLKPDSINTCLSLAETYHKMHEYRRALDYYKKYLELEPGSSDICLKIGNIYSLLGDNRQAIGWLNKSLEVNKLKVESGSPDTYYSLATLYLEEGKYQEAADSINRLLSLKGLNPEICDILADIYYKQGDYDKAIKYLNKALEFLPQRLDKYIKIAEIYKKKGDYQKGIEYLKKALAKHPDSLTAHKDIARFYLDSGMFPEAKKHYRKVIGQNPKNVNAYLELGNIYKNQGYYEKAIQNYLKALKLDNQRSQTYKELAETYYRREDYKNMLETCRRWLSFFPRNFKAHKMFINAYIGMNNFATAKQSIKELRRQGRGKLADDLLREIEDESGSGD